MQVHLCRLYIACSFYGQTVSQMIHWKTNSTKVYPEIWEGIEYKGHSGKFSFHVPLTSISNYKTHFWIFGFLFFCKSLNWVELFLGQYRSLLKDLHFRDSYLGDYLNVMAHFFSSTVIHLQHLWFQEKWLVGEAGHLCGETYCLLLSVMHLAW